MLVMQKGKIVESGNAEEIYNHPQSSYTKELLQSVPKAVG
jgi:peptide/nickel transport system ATP-binding protein